MTDEPMKWVELKFEFLPYTKRTQEFTIGHGIEFEEGLWLSVTPRCVTAGRSVVVSRVSHGTLASFQGWTSWNVVNTTLADYHLLDVTTFTLLIPSTMVDNVATIGAALYVSVIILTRYVTQAKNQAKAAIKLPRPKSFLLSEKSIAVAVTDSKG
jgi:hypothetical protein